MTRHLVFLLAALALRVDAATINGRVVDARTNAPITSLSIVASDEAGRPVVTTTTAADGQYTLVVGPGRYYVETRDFFAVSEYRNEVWPDVPCGETCDLARAQPITLTLNEVRHGIDFALVRPSGELRGRVVEGREGKPAAGATVMITSDKRRNFDTVAADDGTFVFRELGAGRYSISASAKTGCTILSTSPVVAVEVRDGGVTDVALTVAHLSNVSGVIVDSKSGVPIAGAKLRLRGATVTADAAGRFLFTGICPGAVSISAEAPGYTPAEFSTSGCLDACAFDSPGKLFTVEHGRDLELVARLRPHPRVRGVVRDASTGAPIAGAGIIDGSGRVFVTTDAEGRFEGVVSATAASPAQVTMQARVPGYIDSYNASAKVVQAKLYPGDVLDLLFELERGAIFRGKVVARESGQPLVGVRIRATNDHFAVPAVETVTGFDGHYELPAKIGRGFWTIAAEPVPVSEYAGTTIGGTGCLQRGCAWRTGERIRPEPGTEHVLDFALDRAGWIDLDLTDCVTGAALSDANVAFYDTNGDLLGTFNPLPPARRVLIAPGSYFMDVTYKNATWRYPDRVKNNEIPTFRDGRPITVRAGEGTSVSMRHCGRAPHFGFQSSDRVSWTMGGLLAYIVGPDAKDLRRVFFGEEEGVIVERQQSAVRVKAPAHAAGQVWVRTEYADGGSVTLANPFYYSNSCIPPTLSTTTPISFTADDGTPMVKVDPHGTPPFRYEWYSGYVVLPFRIGTGEAVALERKYQGRALFVQITNDCGTSLRFISPPSNRSHPANR